MTFPGFKSLLIAGTALTLLSGCAEKGQFYSWNQELGSDLDEGAFGDPTMNNVLVHAGERDYTIALAERFAAEIPDTINFAFDSAVLDPQAQQILLKQADFIKQFPEVRFRVFGHTDLVGSASYNQRLGLRRAQAAVAFLVSQGIDRGRLEAVASYGETRPIVNTSNEERRNRRTVTEVSGFVDSNPLVLDGKYAAIIYREYVASATSSSTLTGSNGLTAITAGSGS